jgi:TolB protein
MIVGRSRWLVAIGLGLGWGWGCGAQSSPDAPITVEDPCDRAAPGAPWLVYASRASGSYDLIIARSDGSCRAALTSGSADDLYPSWSPGDRVVFASNRGGALGLWVHDLHDGTDAQLATGDLAATSPACAPDGASIAFEGRASGALQTDIFVVPGAGGTPIPIAASAANDAGPAWSPDGLTLYFVSSRTGRWDVFSVPAGGGAATQVTTSSRIIGKPVVSPDGAALYYARTVSGSSSTEVVRFDLTTSAISVVTSHEDSEPAVDPTGGRLAVRSFRNGSADLYLVDAADGAHPLAVTDDPASDGAPAFAPVP